MNLLFSITQSDLHYSEFINQKKMHELLIMILCELTMMILFTSMIQFIKFDTCNNIYYKNLIDLYSKYIRLMMIIPIFDAANVLMVEIECFLGLFQYVVVYIVVELYIKINYVVVYNVDNSKQYDLHPQFYYNAHNDHYYYFRNIYYYISYIEYVLYLIYSFGNNIFGVFGYVNMHLILYDQIVIVLKLKFQNVVILIL